MSERFLRSVPDQPHGPDVEPLLRDLIGDVLRRTRLEQGRTLREVAEEAQVSLPYLSEVERGRKELSSEVLAAIRRALGLSMGDLTGMLHTEMTASAATLIQIGGSFTRSGSKPSGGQQAMLLTA